MYFDTTADFLTRIRNAQQAGHRIVEIPASKLKKRITELLYENGYVYRYTFDDEGGKGTQGVIKIALKYDGAGVPAIRGLQKVSKAGKRSYVGADDLPYVLNGLGIAIVSTSQGVMTDKQARAAHVGGEVICEVY